MEEKHRVKRKLLIRNQKGVAMLIALFAMMIMTIIAVEVSYDTSVDYASSSQAVNLLKAYYAARSGVELSLLRIKLYELVVSQMGNNSAVPQSLIDQIWEMPFAWPPPIPKGLTIAEKSSIHESVKKSAMQAQYVTQISSEGSKIDINNLGSPIPALAQATRNQLKLIFTNKLQNDDKFSEKYSNFDFDRLLNFIADWVSSGTASLNGGSKASFYQDVNKNDDNHYLPPMEPFKTIDELHEVRDMNDDMYSMLRPDITIYGVAGININYCSKTMLMGLDPQITSRIADEILKHEAQAGPFTSKDDFLGYLRGLSVDTTKLAATTALPMYFGPESNFKIVSTGTFGRVSRQIEAVVYDENAAETQLENLMKQSTQAPPTGSNTSGQPGATPPPNANQPNTPSPATNSQVPSGPPNVVYWHED